MNVSGLKKIAGIDGEFYILRKDVSLLVMAIDMKLEGRVSEKTRDQLTHIYNALHGISDIPYLLDDKTVPGFIAIEYFERPGACKTNTIFDLAKKVVRQLALLHEAIANWKYLEAFKVAVASFDNEEFNHWIDWVDLLMDAYDRSEEVYTLLDLNSRLRYSSMSVF